MTGLKEIYKCSVCGNIVEILHTGKGELVCCKQPMDLMKENTVDASREKHVPVIQQDGGNITVKVGSVPHPMEKEHYIEWIEVISGSQGQRVFTEPGQKAEVQFNAAGEEIVVRAYCNLHGLWSAKAGK